VTINPNNVNEFHQEKLEASDFGNMYLLYGQALCVRSSGSILFYKIDPTTKLWTKYHTLDKMRGQIYFIKGNVRIQIVTDEFIYFFLINETTFMPELENVMGNFMQGSQMMFGPKVRFSITYKANQPGFQIFRRKYFHNFKVRLTDYNNEGSKGLNLPSMKKYIMSDIHEGKPRLGLYNESFKCEQFWKVPIKSADIEILYLAVSKDDKKVGVSLGKNIIRDIYEIVEIAIYKWEKDKFELEKLMDFDMHDVCQTFYFSNKNSEELIFFGMHEVFKINYNDDTKERTVIYKM
jgi:hypothetical protein